MRVEIITVGDELISGDTLDVNSHFAAQRLAALGLLVTRITSVGDDYEMVSEALKKAIETSLYAIITGGLGPTDDDMTNDIVARTLKRPLCLNKAMLDQIKSVTEMRGIEMTPALEKMAWLPEDSIALNPGGIPGFYIVEKGTRLYFLPGVPERK